MCRNGAAAAMASTAPISASASVERETAQQHRAFGQAPRRPDALGAATDRADASRHFASWKMMPSVMALAGAQPADAMAHGDAVDAARPRHRPMMDGEDTPSPCLSGTTSARDCMRGRCSVSTNSPPVKSRARLGQQDRHLEREHMLAIKILMQAVVVARAIAQQQRRRPRLAGGMATREEVGMRRRKARYRSPCASFQRLAIRAGRA